MADMLSQAEIDALLGGGSSSDDDSYDTQPDYSSDPDYASPPDALTSEEKDILGEIGNISMGTSATTLFALLNQKVWITTPKVRVLSLRELSNSYSRPCVGIKVDYKEGLVGSNVLVLKEDDVKVIANLMMGGDGAIDSSQELTELDLSAIAEAMNQMVGSSSTSLSSMLKHKIDIDTPTAFTVDFKEDDFLKVVGFQDEYMVAISFRMEIGLLIDSEIMQVVPIEFAKSMVETLKNEMMPQSEPAPPPPLSPPPQQQQMAPPPQQMAPQQQQQQQQPMYDYNNMAPPQQPMYDYNNMAPPQQPMYQQPMYQQPAYQQPMYQQPMQQQYAPQPQPQQNINVQPAQFQNFDMSSVVQQKENIGIIMDVPLEVTVELGRAHKLIKEILEFSPGTIIELDKLAGEPIDILVNGKFVAKGEVVVIDENFGIRITDIVSPENRI